MESFQSSKTKLYRQRFAFYWWILSFQAGAINAGALLSCGRAVSYVTGFGAGFGTSAASGNWSHAWGLLSVPAFFLLGSMTTSILRIRDEAKGFYTSLGRVLAFLFLLLILVMSLGVTGTFGNFNDPLDLSQHYALLVILSFASGMQNAIFGGMIHGVIRSTHLTGTLTDLGLDLGKLFFHKKRSRSELEMSLCRSLSVISFIAGVLLSSFIYLKHHYWGFTIPALSALILSLDSIKAHRKYHHP